MQVNKIIKDYKIKVSAQNIKWYGTEPKWDDMNTLSKQQIESRLGHAYNWYSNTACFEQHDTCLDVAISFLQSQRVPVTNADIAAIKAAKPWLVRGIASTCRMRTIGLVLPADYLTRFTENLKNIISNGNKLLAAAAVAQKVQNNKPVLTVQDHISNAVKTHLVELEGIFDDYATLFKPEFNCYAWLQSKEVKPIIAQRIAAYYQPVLDEYNEAISGKDLELTESYNGFTKKHLKQVRDFLQGIVTDCTTLAVNKNKQRAPRKAKAKSADKLVSKITYLKEDATLKIASINPLAIIGCSELWVYNTKTRMLNHYIASDKSGLSIKGTTLQKYDEKSSQMKKLRKPEDVLAKITQDGVRAISKTFTSLKVKPVMCNGRINKDTLILRAIK